MNLERFGFTPTEARVYGALLQLGGATGYAVARAVGIARANVYQALEGLVRRGAARRSAGVPARYAAIAPATLVAHLQRGFLRDLEALEEELRSLPAGDAATGPGETEVLGAAAQILNRAAALADAAQHELLVVTGPWGGALNDAISRARRRRVATRAVSLAEPAPEGCAVRLVAAADLQAYWGGLPVALAADRRRVLAGVLLSGEAASGIVTDQPGVVPFIRHLLRRETATT